MNNLEARGEYARWEVREQYFGKFDEERIVCHTHSIDNAVTVIKTFLQAHKGRPFQYKATKIADDKKIEYDMLETWELNEITGELEESSYEKYLDWISAMEEKNDSRNQKRNSSRT